MIPYISQSRDNHSPLLQRGVRGVPSLFCYALIFVLTPSLLALAHNTSIAQDENRDVMKGMVLTPKAVRVAANRIEPALVVIESFGGVSAVAGRIGGIRKQGEGNTTGVMISPDGYVITSLFNFIEQPPVITVITSDGVRRVAQLLGRDDTRKICLLKIEEVSDMPVAEMISPEKIQVGQWAISIGVGYGDKNPALSVGIISAKNRIAGRAIQTDANISPANYGGPLIDIEGRMIGVCVPLAPGGRSLAGGVEWYDSGIGFAIPISDTKKLIDRLKDGAHIKRAFLGVQSGNAGDGQGIRIVSVINGTAAKKAELKKGDLLQSIDGKKIENVAEFRNIMAQHFSGDEVEIEFTRGDETKTIKIKLGAPPKPGDRDTPSLFPGRRRAPGPDGKSR